MRRKKKYTKEFNRKIKELNTYKNKLIDVVKMVGLSQQAIDSADAGLNVIVHCDIDVKKFLDILRR